MSGYAENALRHLDKAEAYPGNLASHGDALVAIGWALLAIAEQLAQFEAVAVEDKSP